MTYRDDMDYSGGMQRGYAKRSPYEGCQDHMPAITPEQLRAEALHFRKTADRYEQQAREIEQRQARDAEVEKALDAEYGPRY